MTKNVFILLCAFMMFSTAAHSKESIIFKSYGGIILKDSGIFTTDEYTLNYKNGEWRYFNSKTQGIKKTPFVVFWGGNMDVVFDKNGIIYFVDKRDGAKYPIKLINGEWQTNFDSGWFMVNE